MKAYSNRWQNRIKNAIHELFPVAERSKQVIRHEGIISFLDDALTKIRLREFHILPEVPGGRLSVLLDEKSRALQATNQMQKLNFGVNFAGYLTGQFGIATSSRAFANALDLAGVPHVVNNIVAEGHGEKRKTSIEFSRGNPYAINLIHINVDQISQFVHLKGLRYFRGRYNIGIWYWELFRFPDEWIPAFRLCDEIWTTSSFTTENLSRISPVPILKMRYPLWIDTTLVDKQPRNKFGLKKNEYVFLFMFDFGSVFERKNPLSLLEAYRMAFGPDDRVVLVLNCINDWTDRVSAATLERQALGLNVKILKKHLSERDYFSLLAACDCYISLHRSEGLGLPIAEAMYLGKPVIATAYGGNTDFMNTNNSLLVKYSLVELERDYGPYKKGSAWAQPDIGHAAELMRWVFDNIDETRKIGENASKYIKEYMNPALASQEIKTRLEQVCEKRPREHVTFNACRNMKRVGVLNDS